MDDVIGSAEARQILNIDKSTLSRWVASGRITPLKQLPGRTGAMVFLREDVEKIAADKAPQQ